MATGQHIDWFEGFGAGWQPGRRLAAGLGEATKAQEFSSYMDVTRYTPSLGDKGFRVKGSNPDTRM